jgi:putative DNA primase/helicase
MGNAERLVSRHGQDIRYCYPWKKWFIWDGRLWIPDERGEIERRAKKTVRSIPSEITLEMDSETVEKIYKHAGRSEADARIQALIKLAHSEVPILPQDMDNDQFLLNVENGTLDLKSDQFLKHDRAHFITKIAPVKFDSSAQCPLWSQFLDRIMDGNSGLIEYLKRIIGYALTGDTSEQCFFIFYGTGANGKTTLIETIRSILGDYALQADFETFLNTKNGRGIPNDIAGLQGARFVSAIEAGAGRSLNESLIKQLTGGEPIRARFLYSEFFEFLPTLKLILATNHKPRIQNQDLGIWRRVRLIPFNITIPKEEQVRKLAEKLREESSGILNWAIEGCQEWLISGLGEPEEVATATNLYREEMDSIGAFLDEKCVLASTTSVKTSDLKKAYQDWCEENKEDPVGPKIFASLLESRGCKAGKSNAVRVWKGIDLKTGTSGTLDK